MGYTIKQKIDICLKSESNPEMTQADLADWAKIQYRSEKAPSQTTISRILSSKNDLIASKETDFQLVRRRKQSNPLLRRILTEWITQAIWENIPITTPIIQLTANSIWTRLPNSEKDGNGVFNHKWCNHFVKRLNINLHGDNNAILSNPGQHKLNKVWKIDEKLDLKDYLNHLIEKENYRPQDIFTIDEFKLFYSLPLDQIFDVSSVDNGLKQSSFTTENSLTIMLGCNIDGSEKLTPLVVGKYDKFDISQSSHNNFKNLSSNNISKHNLMNKITESYQIFYKSNINKWITSSMFQNYLLALEHKLSNASPNRKIVIILDDSSSHRIINLQFKNIKLCYLKNNTNHKNPFSSMYNGDKFDYLPMSFGIVEEFKILYRLQQYLEMINIQRIHHKKEFKNNDSNHFLKANSITLNNFKTMVNGSNSDSVLSESDYQIPLIKVIEWVKRSWDSISKEKIFMSWKKTHLLNLNENWPSSDPVIANAANKSLLPLNSITSNYNNYKSYDKLVEIMKYLNVVIPWNVDDLLGLVNERGKITLSYVSIEEIIGSCLLESFGNEDIDNPDPTKNPNHKPSNVSADNSNSISNFNNNDAMGTLSDLNNNNLLAHENWYSSNQNQIQNQNQSQNQNVNSLVSPSLSSSTVSSNSPMNTVPSTNTGPHQSQVQDAQHSLPTPHGSAINQNQLLLNNFNGVDLTFPEFTNTNTISSNPVNFNSLLDATNPTGSTTITHDATNGVDIGLVERSPHYSVGSPVNATTSAPVSAGGVFNHSAKSNSLSYDSSKALSTATAPSLSKFASTNSVPVIDTFSDPSRKHKLDDDTTLYGNGGTHQSNKRPLYEYSPTNPNGTVQFPYVSTPPLNDSLPSTASSPPYQRGTASLNQGVLSKTVFSGISYKSRSSTNLTHRGHYGSHGSNSPTQLNSSAYLASSQKIDDSELMIMLTRLIDNSKHSDSIKLSSNTVDELKVNLAELQNKYSLSKHEGFSGTN